MTEYEWGEWRNEVDRALKEFSIFMAKMETRERVEEEYREISIKKLDSQRNWLLVIITFLMFTISLLTYMAARR